MPQGQLDGCGSEGTVGVKDNHRLEGELEVDVVV
jgi:hypothetical protein